MFASKYISIPLFLSSFIIGLFCVYMTGSEIKMVYKYPSPSNYKDIMFKDKSEQCFQFKPVPSNCPINPFSIKTVPVQ
jgi:hypothetical protein